MKSKTKNKNEISYYITQFFLQYLIKQKNLSFNTIKSYRDTFKIMFKYFTDVKNINLPNISFNDFSRKNIIEYLD